MSLNSNVISPHHFHIPVMGTGFTIDTPIKVAHLGIHSVISLVDDVLVEKMRRHYCEKLGIAFYPITEKEADCRALRITAWLNLVADQVDENFKKLKQDRNSILRYINLLPSDAPLKKRFDTDISTLRKDTDLFYWADEHLIAGSIDVNVMTKLDRESFDKKGELLPSEFNDAHAAVRGYAQSRLRSKLVFSAGLNPRLYGYLDQFTDFIPSEDGNIAKKIALKVSDYRSALVQGKFLAKKGIWVSEYRIESGLNCGGHAFATDGYLMGPILEEFRVKKEALRDEIWQIVASALASKGLTLPSVQPELHISAQGGVGTFEEHMMLREQYGVDSVGWGTPFLLVAEVTNVDKETRAKLVAAREEDLELSKVSPLGVPYNNLKSNSKDIEKLQNIQKGRPGSSCPKKYIALNTEFTEQGICMASRQYQHLKLKDLYDKGLPYDEYEKAQDSVVEKSCICVGLGTAALLVNELETKVEGEGVSVCPGPNIAYFEKEYTLEEMVDHIYGKRPSKLRSDRPHMFVKELNIYIDYLSEKMEGEVSFSSKQGKYFSDFIANLGSGITYYRHLFGETHLREQLGSEQVLEHLSLAAAKLDEMQQRVPVLK